MSDEEKRRICGKELDMYIENELLAMEREGLEKAPIKAITVYARLKAKGIISGKVSTLSTPARKELIKKYQQRQHNQSDLTKEEVELLEGRR